MQLRLIVIRTPDIKKLSDFYSQLGLQFHYHKHGNSPFHYSATVGQTVLEIYPLAKGQEVADKHLRLGFTINHFDVTMAKLKTEQVVFFSEPMETDFGFMTVVEDPDGRKLELYRNDSAV